MIKPSKARRVVLLFPTCLGDDMPFVKPSQGNLVIPFNATMPEKAKAATSEPKVSQQSSDLHTTAEVLSKINARDLKPQDKKAIKCHVLQPAGRRVKKQKTTPQKETDGQGMSNDAFLARPVTTQMAIVRRCVTGYGT